jgi:hypothetical protein
MIFYGFYHKLIIIQIPKKRTSSQASDQRNAQHKTVRIFYWDGEKIAQEDKELIYSGNIQSTLAELVSRWLSVLEEEKLLSKKVSVQSVLLDIQSITAYVSFDRNPLKKELSTYEKLMIIESLLKTLKESDFSVQKVQFLSNHRPIQDTHLDFERPWVLQGYSL